MTKKRSAGSDAAALPLLAIALVLAVVPGTAQSESALLGLDCTFAAGTSASYEKGAFQAKPPSPIGFSIADIDLDHLSASLDAGSGAPKGKLAIARAIGANHFLEIAGEGFWTITTVYDKDAATGLHPAVHSRHLGIVGQPFVAQYTGSCRGK